LTSFNEIYFIKARTIFWNLCDFLNITVLQSSAATSLWYAGICKDHFIEKCVLSSGERIFLNRLIFREVVDMSRVSCFFNSHCRCCHYCLQGGPKTDALCFIQLFIRLNL